MLYALLAVIGLLPVLPVLLRGSPILNNDMLVAYFCYFWDFHRNWSWSHPLVFWSSSYQCGMPMHAYWQSGFLYPITWMLFGPLSPYYGIYVFYAFHFALAVYGFLRLGPRLRLSKPASLWAGICFSLSGTMLARYEHATFLAGWAWMPLVLSAYFSLRDNPGPRSLFLYAAAIALQAFGGHPQASATTALMIGVFTASDLMKRKKQGNADVTSPARFRLSKIGWMMGGHLLAIAYCLPMLIPMLQLVNATDRYDGTAWEDGKSPAADFSQSAAAEATNPTTTEMPSVPSSAIGHSEASPATLSAKDKLAEGVFSFEKFATGGMRPLHLLSLLAPNALGSPSNASWWGGEVWGEVFLYLGGLGFFFCFFASWKRGNADIRLLWLIGILGLWIAFGKHLGASQILYHVPLFNNFRRPARFVILFVMAIAAVSGHGFQRWMGGNPRAARLGAKIGITAIVTAAVFLVIRLFPEVTHKGLSLVEHFKKLDPTKDYGQKVSDLMGRWALDFAFLAVSGAAAWYCAFRPRARMPLLFVVLLADLLRVHWDHFYLFPSSYYRTQPVTAQVLDEKTSPFWRVSHYLEYPGLQMWQMHNDPLAHFELFEREKNCFSYGIHAVFGLRHVSAHLPLLWKWEPGTSPGGKSARYLFTNRDLNIHKGDSLKLLNQIGEVRTYEIKGWKPRIEVARNAGDTSDNREGSLTANACPTGYSGYRGVCVQEIRDGHLFIRGDLHQGDSLIIRERFTSEWNYRVGSGPWRKPLETWDHFMALPILDSAEQVEVSYQPSVFYRTAGVCLGGSLLLFGSLGLVRKRKGYLER